MRYFKILCIDKIEKAKNLFKEMKEMQEFNNGIIDEVFKEIPRNKLYGSRSIKVFCASSFKCDSDKKYIGFRKGKDGHYRCDKRTKIGKKYFEMLGEQKQPFFMTLVDLFDLEYYTNKGSFTVPTIFKLKDDSFILAFEPAKEPNRNELEEVTKTYLIDNIKE